MSGLPATSPGDTARLYHKLSSYAYWPGDDLPPPADDPLVVQDFVSMVPEHLPPPTKLYPSGLPTVELPREWPRVGAAATTVLAGRSVVPPAAVDIAGLARLLHLSAGIVRVRAAKPPYTRPWLFRAAGSAGGRFPLEVYVSAKSIEGVPDGVHWYDPIGHALVQVGSPADGERTTLIVTGIPWRTGWKYAERGYRHIYWDAGSMLAQTLTLAESARFGPRLWTRFPDETVAALVGADGIQEFAVALVSLGEGDLAIRPGGAARAGSVGDAPIEFPLITLAQHAGELQQLGDAWSAAPSLPDDVPGSDDLDTVILRRGSTRRMDVNASVARDVFDFTMAVALRGTTVHHYVAVHAVDGVTPGIYGWPDLDHPVRRGPVRDELLSACWDQDLGRDAAFVVMSAIDLDTIDDHRYREAQLDAGIVEGRLHLAAYALGIGASGMTFLDDEIEGLLGAPLAALLFTCIGIPTYPRKAGGRPGAPVAIITPPPGDTPRDASR